MSMTPAMSAKADSPYGQFLSCDAYSYSPTTGQEERSQHFNQAVGAVQVTFPMLRDGKKYLVTAKADRDQSLGSIEVEDLETATSLYSSSTVEEGRNFFLLIGNGASAPARQSTIS